MTTTPLTNPVLDWRLLAPTPEIHVCDCTHCHQVGLLEDPDLPFLVVADVDGVEYVTDRFLMVRGDLAPIPEDYEGTVSPDRPKASALIAALGDITTDPPTGHHFQGSVLLALQLTGWELRLLTTAPGVSTVRVGVIDQMGDPIGIAISAKPSDSTAAYGEWEADE